MHDQGSAIRALANGSFAWSSSIGLRHSLLSHINTPSFHFNVYAFFSSQLGDEFILETYGILWSSLYNMLTKVLSAMVYLPSFRRYLIVCLVVCIEPNLPSHTSSLPQLTPSNGWKENFSMEILWLYRRLRFPIIQAHRNKLHSPLSLRDFKGLLDDQPLVSVLSSVFSLASFGTSTGMMADPVEIN